MTNTEKVNCKYDENDKENIEDMKTAVMHNVNDTFGSLKSLSDSVSIGASLISDGLDDFINIETPYYKLEDAYCQTELKDKILEYLIFPVIFENHLHNYQIEKSFLITGQNLSGITHLLRCILGEIEAFTLITTDCANVVEIEKIGGIFERMIELAGNKSPTVIYVKNIHVLFNSDLKKPQHQQAINSLKILIKKIRVKKSQDNFIVASSKPTKSNIKILFDQCFDFYLPDDKTRLGLIKYHLGDNYEKLNNEQINNIVASTQNMGFGEIMEIFKSVKKAKLHKVFKMNRFFFSKTLGESDKNKTNEKFPKLSHFKSLPNKNALIEYTDFITALNSMNGQSK